MGASVFIALNVVVKRCEREPREKGKLRQRHRAGKSLEGWTGELAEVYRAPCTVC